MIAGRSRVKIRVCVGVSLEGHLSIGLGALEVVRGAPGGGACLPLCAAWPGASSCLRLESASFWKMCRFYHRRRL